ncbi:MAG TPA: phosphate ABC transporter, permease protein PstA, partial [Sulfitobacter sp.]|nr:phosphate ABC transporter, permease protein PstA [Sulfitobacter sp.]
MSDIPNPAAPFADPRGASLLVQDGRTKRRNAAEGRFKLYGIIAIVIGLLMLLTLLFTIISRGTGAFQQTYVTLSVPLLEDKLDKNGNRDLEDIKKVSTFGYSPLLKAAFENKVEAAGIETDLKSKDMADILSKDAAAQLRDHVLANPELIGTAAEFEFLTNSRVDGYLKGRVTRESIANDKNISAEQLDFVDVLIADGSLEKRFNLDFITGADASDARPEAAGMGVSMIGSFAMMLVVLVLALPIGVAASIYLEEFAPKNWITDIIEVNISNLAAVPSIVFGILGLAVFINYMHLPNSAPLVGGLVLTLMTLPTI